MSIHIRDYNLYTIIIAYYTPLCIPFYSLGKQGFDFSSLYATVMGMKRYKKLLFQVGILLFIVAIFLFVLEQQKRYITIDFSKRYTSNKTIELSGFEQEENWQGNYSYDSERVMEGKSSIIFTSWYGKETVIQKERKYDLKQGYAKGYASLYVADKEKIKALTVLKLALHSGKQKKEYDLRPQLIVGWNRIPFAVPAWNTITNMSFRIVSKENAITEVGLDRLWIENSAEYKTDVVDSSSDSLSLRTIGDRTYLFLAAPTMETLQFKEPQKIKKGIVTISFIPEHTQKIVFGLNDTAMEISGNRMDTCTLTEQGAVAKKYNLANNKAPNDMYVFVQAELRKDKILYSLSNNGVTYEQCGIVTSHTTSPVKLSLLGSYLIDSYSVEY